MTSLTLSTGNRNHCLSCNQNEVWINLNLIRCSDTAHLVLNFVVLWFFLIRHLYAQEFSLTRNPKWTVWSFRNVIVSYFLKKKKTHAGNSKLGLSSFLSTSLIFSHHINMMQQAKLNAAALGVPAVFTVSLDHVRRVKLLILLMHAYQAWRVQRCVFLLLSLVTFVGSVLGEFLLHPLT